MVEVVILVVNIIILFQVQFPEYSMGGFFRSGIFCQTPVLGLGLGVDFTFAWDNHNDNDNNGNNNHNKPHLNFVKGTVLGDKEQGVGLRDMK